MFRSHRFTVFLIPILLVGVLFPHFTMALPYWDTADILIDPNLNGATSIAKQGNYLYVVSKHADSLTIIDASNPASLTIVGVLVDHTNLDLVNDVEISGNYAYVVSIGSGNLTVIDISTPSLPTFVTSIPLPPIIFPEGIELIGTTAYIVGVNNFNHVLNEVDISIPLSPSITSTVLLSNAVGSGNININQGPFGYLYIANQYQDTIYVLDTTQTTPTVIGSISDVRLDHTSSIGYSGTYLYTASEGLDDIVVIDVSQPTLPVIITTLSDTARSIGVYNDFLYVHSLSGLNVYDISASTNPVLLDSTSSGSMSGLESLIDGTTLYASSQNFNINEVRSFTLVGPAPTTVQIDIEFTSATYSDLEASGGNLPVLTVSGDITTSSNTVEVAYTGGSATGSGTDFSFSSPVIITIPAGNYTTPQTIPLTGLSIIDDSLAESNETITFELQNPSIDVSLGTQDATTYTIMDDDSPGGGNSGSSTSGGSTPPTRRRKPISPLDPITPQCPYFTEYMKIHDKDIYQGGTKHEVAKLQEFLTDQNFQPTMPIDGIFGTLTHTAVALWQKHYENEILSPWSLFNKNSGTGWFYQSSQRWANMQKGCAQSINLDNGIHLESDPTRLRIFY